MANSIIDDTTAIAKRLREITGETTKAKVVKIDCIHCRDVGWVRSVRWAAHESGGFKSLRRSNEERRIQRWG